MLSIPVLLLNRFFAPVAVASARRALVLLYGGGFQVISAVMMRPFIDAGEIGEEEAEQLLRLVLESTALMLIEEIVLYGQAEPSDELRRTGDFIARFVEAGIEAGLHRQKPAKRPR